MKDNHAWFVDTLSCFKPPNQKSKDALNSKNVKIGSHQMNIEPQLKDKALQISSCLVSCFIISVIVALNDHYWIINFMIIYEALTLALTQTRLIDHNHICRSQSVRLQTHHYIKSVGAIEVIMFIFGVSKVYGGPKDFNCREKIQIMFLTNEIWKIIPMIGSDINAIE